MGDLDRIRWRCRRGLLELDLVLQAFLERGYDRLGPEERAVVSQLLEGQVFGQRMHTSCGLFWEDLNRLEMRNNLAYAARAIGCVEAATGASLGTEFRRRLQGARSAATSATGDRIYTEVAGSSR